MNCVALVFALGCALVAVCSTERPPVLGGYVSVSTEDPTIFRMSHYATLALGKKDLIFISSAATQSVAGTNYKLNLTVRNKRNKIEHCSVVIWEVLWEQKLEVMEFACE